MPVTKPKLGAASRGNAGKGRPKGVPNKITGQLKDMVLQALDQAGGVDYLARQANESPAAFLTLVGKVLPLALAGPDGGPVRAVVDMSDEALAAIACGFANASPASSNEGTR